MVENISFDQFQSDVFGELKIFYMNHPCSIHAPHKILLICLEPKCHQSRLCCLLCADERHSKHELISVNCFYNTMQSSLQINRKNPDKTLLLKQLNKSKADIMNVPIPRSKRLQTIKNKLIGLVGECEDKVEQYYSKIFHSFAIDSHSLLVKDLETHFTSQKISSFIKTMKEFEGITLGSINDMQPIMYACIAIFKEKVAEVQKNCQAQLEQLRDAWNQVSFAKPKDFLYQFSKERRQVSFLALSDSQMSVMRTNGNGGYPMCLSASPFDPINRSVAFSIDKTEGNKKSICLGVCLQNVVRGINFANCGGGLGKGIYAIDQNSPYSGDNEMLASWNHHDSQFNQTNVGNNNLVGWTMKEGDVIRVQIDYYNSNVIFMKGNQEEWDEDEQLQVYEMPIKLNAGPIYAFVSCQNKGDKVTINC